ncbi:MAG TPA: hypothetical protein VFC00_31035 [Micromonosporaceae bacterium]|nr:hypothetical protein [Micromonosporaceae bacterium]
MSARLWRYVLRSYPPAFYVPFALCWSLGVTALFVLADPRVRWQAGGAAVAAVTFAVDLLLLRAIDDLRDLDYDRVHNPDRPLAAGMVRERDLVVLLVGGTALLLALNAGHGTAAAVLALQLGYAALLILLDRRWGWPPGQALILNAAVALPVQVLSNLYLYAVVLDDAGLRPSWRAALPVLVAVIAFLHLEVGRKVTRRSRPGERTYAARYGANPTALVGVAAALASVALALIVLRPWAAHADAGAWGWLVLAPLAFIAVGGYRFWLAGAVRWPLLAAALFLLTSDLAYLVIGVAGRELA